MLFDELPAPHLSSARTVLGLFRGREGEMDDKAVMVVLAACARAGMVGEGREVFRRMMRPALQHYASTVEMLGRAGEVEEAEGLMKPMEAPPRDRVMCVVLAAFRPRAHGRVNVAEREWPSRCMAMHA